jgi:tetratricopeptide (TPR) repeat protein
MSATVARPEIAPLERRHIPAWRRTALLFLAVALFAIGWKVANYAQLRLAVVAAREHLRNVEPFKAIERLQGVSARFPQSAEVQFLLGVANRRAGRQAEVEPYLAQAERLGWDPLLIKRQRYLAWFEIGDLKRAGPYLKQLISEGGSDDDAEEVCETLVRGYFSALLFREADLIIDYWHQWQPLNPRPLLLRAQGAILLHNLSSEIAAYREILRFAPKHYETRVRLAQALLESHDFGEAVDLLEECSRERPHDPANLIGLAACLEQRAEPSQAKERLEQALRCPLSPTQRATVRSLQARMAISARHNDEAIACLTEAVELMPDDLQNVYGLAQALLRAGQEAEGQKYLAKWRELKKINDRLDEIRDVILRDPDNADLRCEIGKLLIAKNSKDVVGVNWLLSAIMRDPNHRESHEALASYYRSTGQEELAQRHQLTARTNKERNGNPVTTTP